jgi:integrase
MQKVKVGQLATRTSLTFDDLVDEWLEVARHEQSTRYQTERYLDRHVRPAIGSFKIERITPGDLTQLYLGLEHGTGGHPPLAPSTVVRIHSVVRACLQFAVRSDYLSQNVAERATLPRLPPPSIEVPDIDTVRAVLATAYEIDKEMFVFLRISSATGLRRGSVCGMKWTDVNLVRRIFMHRRAIGLGKGAPYEKSTKTGASHTMSLDRRTTAILRWHRLRMLDRCRTLGGLDPEGFVFSSDPTCSKPWRPDHATKMFRQIADTAGVKAELRSFRHFHATSLIGMGVDVKTTSARLTHARTSTTMDRYVSYMPATDRAAAEAFADYLDA